MDANMTSKNRLKSNSLRARWAIIMLSVVVFVDVIAVTSDLAELTLISRVTRGEVVSLAEANTNDKRQQAIGILQLALLIPTGTTYLLWIYRANENLQALGAKDIRFTPGWSVGNFLVPILNVIRPPQVVSEIWKASDPSDKSGMEWKTAPNLPMINWWWIAFIGSGFLGRWAGRIDFATATLQQFVNSSRLVALSDLVRVAAGILAILIIRDINHRQEEKANLNYGPVSISASTI